MLSPKVLSRRQQLGLAADIKAAKEAEKGSGKGVGRGGGRGRGRGRGKARQAADIPEEPKTADPEATPEPPKRRHRLKRAPTPKQTPERRQLFADPDPEEGDKDKPMETSPPVKQPKKRSKRSRAAKAKAAPAPEVPAPEVPCPEVPGHEVPEPEAPGPDQPAAGSEGKGDEKKDDGKAKEKGKGEGAKVPGKVAKKSAITMLRDAKEKDKAGWFHVQQLHKALKFHRMEDKSQVPKYEFWRLSAYWGTGRVGLLQKQGKKFQHIISFGGQYVKNIAMPAHAGIMYVSCWLNLRTHANMVHMYAFYSLWRGPPRKNLYGNQCCLF